MTHLLISPILVPLVFAIFTGCFRHHHSHSSSAAIAGALIHLASAGWLLSVVTTQGVVVLWVGSWPSPPASVWWRIC